MRRLRVAFRNWLAVNPYRTVQNRPEGKDLVGVFSGCFSRHINGDVIEPPHRSVRRCIAGMKKRHGVDGILPFPRRLRLPYSTCAKLGYR